ncbi:C3a anaphylatoxin chemotactic receptor [Eptesicus fuscus]|uniref:C3a anaphylatoxin chemotactic receptor n=1 Tax=Eptesicus fuscus TaxID=29078 RepID=UPI0024047C3C|nr:C3a anaphylatoxin chemotactic receptor [Eptesicus fuscus]
MEYFPDETNSTDIHSQPSYEPPEILSMVILSLTFLLGLPGNGLVLWVAGLKMKWTVNTVWFLHLTLADFLCCLSLPFSLVHLALQGHWPYGWLLCKLIPSIIILNMFASVFLLTAISLDRCLLVLKPIWCQNHRNVRTAFTICGCIWAVAFAMCIPVFMYRETFRIDNHTMCGYSFGSSSSPDYSDYINDQLENASLDYPIVQWPGEMIDRSDAFSSQRNDHPWTTTTLPHSETFQRPPGDSVPVDSTSQHPYYNLSKPDDGASPTIPIGLPIEDHRINSTDDSDAFLSTDLELFSSTSSNALYTIEPSQYFQYYTYTEDFIEHDNKVPTPKLIITITRLVMGFLLPCIVMVTCYSLIIFQMWGRSIKAQSKTFQVAIVVVVVFIVCWAPYHIFGVLFLFYGSETPLNEALLSWDSVSIALASANSCFNPFLYALMGKNFREKARQSVQGILEAAFSEGHTHSTSCTQSKGFSKTHSSTAV